MSYGAILGQNKTSTGGTTYTNEQILNPSDATLIGLNSNAFPADMFHTLATVGDLHVWKRTKQVGEKVPAGYTLGQVQSLGSIANATYSNGASVTIQYSSSVSVLDNGTVSLVSPSETTITYSNPSGFPNLSNKFFLIKSINQGDPGSFENNQIVFVAQNGYLSYIDSPGQAIVVWNYQTVTGYPAVPPGTYVDYPVSVNPNAYQEGSNAKPAGYTLGALQSGQYVLNYKDGTGARYTWQYSDSVTVSDSGQVSLATPISDTGIDYGNLSTGQALLGKFATPKLGNYGSDFSQGTIYFIPSNAQITNDTGQRLMFVSKYQPVTGYPAIPAGTTIEYLGKLGDKERIVTGSYKGAGTYGINNPTVLTFDAPPKIVFIQKNISNAAYSPAAIFIKGISCTAVAVNSASSTGTSSTPELSACIVAWKDNTISFYNEKSSEGQLNSPNLTYKYAAIL